MLKQNYDAIYLIINENYIKIKTGVFRYNPGKNHYLTNVTVYGYSDQIIIHGYKRNFKIHDDYKKYKENELKKVREKYCVLENEIYKVEPNKIMKFLFKCKPKMRIKRAWYVKKNDIEEKLFIFHNKIKLIEEHTN